MGEVLSLLAAINSLSPLAVIGLLGTIIFLLVKGKTSTDRKVDAIRGNDLHELGEMAESLRRIEGILQTTNDNVVWIRARINGHQ